MVEKIVDEMVSNVKMMQTCILKDIEDIKQAKHESLLNRNDEKNELIETITANKMKLNEALVEAMQSGVDINIYRDKVDSLEVELKKLYDLNRKLSMIVEPIQKMYKDIVDDITQKNGGKLFDVKA